MRIRRRRSSDRRRQDNGRRNACGNGNFLPHNRGSLSASKGNISGLTHATTPQQSRLTPLHPRVPSRGPPPHLQGNSSGLTHATNVAAVPTHPPAPSSAHGPGLASTAPTMRYCPAFSGHTNPNARHPGTFQVQPSPIPCRPEDSAAYHCLRHHITDTPPQLTPTHR